MRRRKFRKVNIHTKKKPGPNVPPWGTINTNFSEHGSKVGNKHSFCHNNPQIRFVVNTSERNFVLDFPSAHTRNETFPSCVDPAHDQNKLGLENRTARRWRGMPPWRSLCVDVRAGRRARWSEGGGESSSDIGPPHYRGSQQEVGANWFFFSGSRSSQQLVSS